MTDEAEQHHPEEPEKAAAKAHRDSRQSPTETSDKDHTTAHEPIKTEEEAAKPLAAVPDKQGKFARFKAGWKSWWANPRKRYGTLAALVVILVAMFAVPTTRYSILGLVIKKPIIVSVVDSKSGAPISGVVVAVRGKQVKTGAAGKVTVTTKLGKANFVVSKKYYQTRTAAETVTLSKSHNTFKISIVALGRQVSIKTVNEVTGEPLANAFISFGGGETKTDKHGLATVVVPSAAANQKAQLSLNGYNDKTITITVADKLTAANTFQLTPAGKIYFLSNQSGKIDVVKSNLDGTGREVVVSGTGNEEPADTSLLASRDWKYLALLAKRSASSGATASVYLIDTSNDKLTTIDEGNANFSLVGWTDDTFVYQVSRNSVDYWQPNKYALKSYNATSGKGTVLDQTAGEGTGSNDYGYTTFSGVYILENEIVYAQNWNGSYSGSHLNGKSVSLLSIKPDGSGQKTIKDFPIPNGFSYYSINLSLYEPYGLYVQVPATSGSSNTYYEYEDGKLTAKPDLTDEKFYEPYSTYLISPSSNATFWSDERDGKNTLFIGGKDADGAKTIASLSDYNPYGWYSDNYILMSKNGSELYIASPDNGAHPVKVTDYYKTPLVYRGYGGGYGGL